MYGNTLMISFKADCYSLDIDVPGFDTLSFLSVAFLDTLSAKSSLTPVLFYFY